MPAAHQAHALGVQPEVVVANLMGQREQGGMLASGRGGEWRVRTPAAHANEARARSG